MDSNLNRTVELGKTLKERRRFASMTLQQLSRISGVSPSYLSRIEKGQRFPSAWILRRLAVPLGFTEIELLSLAEYMSAGSSHGSSSSYQPEASRLDPLVASALSREPKEVQRSAVDILGIIKVIASGLCLPDPASER